MTETVDDPYQIQQQINDKRYDFAKAQLAQDEVVQQFVEHYQATIDDTSIVAK